MRVLDYRLAKVLALLLLAMLGGTGCAMRNVDMAAGFSPTSVKTVALRPPPVDTDNVYHTSIFNDRVTAALRHEFDTRGIRVAADAATPDALVRWQLKANSDQGEVSRRDMQNWFFRHHYGSEAPPPSRSYPVGTLIVDLVDPNDTDRLLWRGWQEITLRKPTVSAKIIREEVARIARGLDQP